MATDRIAEPDDGPSTEFLREQADCTTSGCAVRAGAPPNRAGRSTGWCSPARRHARPLRQDPPVHLQPASTSTTTRRAFLTVEIDGLRVSFFVCYDLGSPTSSGRRATTDCYVVVANWPESRRTHWRALLRRARSRTRRTSSASIASAKRAARVCRRLDDRRPARRVARRAARTETTISAPIDRREVAKVRAEFPFLPDRR